MFVVVLIFGIGIVWFGYDDVFVVFDVVMEKVKCGDLDGEFDVVLMYEYGDGVE